MWNKLISWLSIIILALANPVYAKPQVDVLLILSIDNSRSVDDEEYEIQRRGYMEALTSPRLHEILLSNGATVGLLMYEWASAHEQTVIVPCMMIRTPEDFLRASFLIGNHRRSNGTWTAVGSAMLFALQQADNCSFEPIVTVLDISGDGTNNHGPSVVEAREEMLARGWTINTLPIENRTQDFLHSGTLEQQNRDLVEWYRENVQGGPFSFTRVAHSFEDLPRHILAKITREVAEGVERAWDRRKAEYAAMLFPY